MSDEGSDVDRSSEDEEAERLHAVAIHSRLQETGLTNFPFLKNVHGIMRAVEAVPAQSNQTQGSWSQGEKNFWGHTNVTDRPPPAPLVIKHRPGDIVDPAKFSNKETIRMYDDNGGACAVGAGDHHTYRKIRRRVLAREYRMTRDHKEKVAKEQHEAKVRTEKEELAAIAAKKAEKRKRKKELQQEAKRKSKLEKLIPVKNDGSFFEMFQAQMAKMGGAEGADSSNALTALASAEPAPSLEATSSLPVSVSSAV